MGSRQPPARGDVDGTRRGGRVGGGPPAGGGVEGRRGGGGWGGAPRGGGVFGNVSFRYHDDVRGVDGFFSIRSRGGRGRVGHRRWEGHRRCPTVEVGARFTRPPDA